MQIWNPWHGCQKKSPGCAHCYMYRRDAQYGIDSRLVQRTKSFSLPVQKNRDGSWKLPPGGTVYTCMTSDFFIEEADEWRKTAWDFMKIRSDVHFVVITKRIERFSVQLPEDWGKGYGNVTLCATCENQAMTDERLPLLLAAPLRHREVILEPMLEAVELSAYLRTGKIERVTCGGESGEEARPCDYRWILSVRQQCLSHGVSFYFKQTGARFLKDGKLYQIPRKLQMEQARKAHLNIE